MESTSGSGLVSRPVQQQETPPLFLNRREKNPASEKCPELLRVQFELDLHA